jgi:hypothetical protein
VQTATDVLNQQEEAVTEGDPFQTSLCATIHTPEGREIRLECGDRLRVGRCPDSPMSDVCGDNVSWNHAEIYVDETDAYVVDTNSTNGTFVDGNRVAPGSPVSLNGHHAIELGTDPPLRLGVKVEASQ